MQLVDIITHVQQQAPLSSPHFLKNVMISMGEYGMGGYTCIFKSGGA